MEYGIFIPFQQNILMKNGLGKRDFSTKSLLIVSHWVGI